MDRTRNIAGPGAAGRPRDHALTLNWLAEGPALAAAMGLPARLRSKAATEAMRRIAAFCWVHARRGDGRRISYSRDRSTRPDRRGLGADAVLAAVAALEEAGIIVGHELAKAVKSGWQSSFAVAPTVAGIALGREQQPRYSSGDVIRLKAPDGTPVPYDVTDRVARDRRYMERLNAALPRVDPPGLPERASRRTTA